MTVKTAKDRRVQILRKLCRGKGLRSNLHLLTSDDLVQFKCTGRDEFVELIDSTLRLAISRESLSAMGDNLRSLQRALALYEDAFPGLLERRQEQIIALGISEDTLRRRETIGVEYLIEIVTSLELAEREVEHERPSGVELRLEQINATLLAILEILKEQTSK